MTVYATACPSHACNRRPVLALGVRNKAACADVYSTCYYIGPLIDVIQNSSAAAAFNKAFSYAVQLSATSDAFVTNILLQAFEGCQTNRTSREAPGFLGTNYGPAVRPGWRRLLHKHAPSRCCR